MSSLQEGTAPSLLFHPKTGSEFDLQISTKPCMLQTSRVSSAHAETYATTCPVNINGRRQCIAAVAAISSSSSTSTAAAAMSRRIILFFRNDLRLRDNVVVHEAVQRVQRGEYAEVLPVYCYDPRSFALSPWGLSKTGPHRAAFLQSCVSDLSSSLQQLGSGLLVSVGAPEAVIASALEGAAEGGSLVLTQQEVTQEETDVDAAIRRAIKGKAKLECLWGSTLYHIDDLPYEQGLGDMPNVFTPFKDKVEAHCQVRAELPFPKAGQLPLPSSLPAAVQQQWSAPLPTWQQLPWPQGQTPQQPQPNSKAALQFKGGESEALKRMQHYFWDTDLVTRYFDIRNGMLGADYSTKFAPWLASGCISPRTIYHEVKKYEQQRTANKSTYWVIWELTCRDWFRFYADKQGSRIFWPGGPAGLRNLRWSPDPELFTRWATGTTGMPLVDANMRELAATGWMSNRGRQNVASYLALDLGVDWRRGADLFEHLLLDYDVASNWGNWVAAAGLTGGRVNHFNITKQSKDYDPDGDYIRHWIPELSKVPGSKVHAPWLLTAEEQEQYGFKIGLDYPEPIPASRFGRPHGGNYIGGDPAGATAPVPAASAHKPGRKARKAQQASAANP